MSVQKTVQRHVAPAQPDIYLTSSDLVVRQFWVAGAAGFAYELDPARLLTAMQTIVDHHYPILTCRVRQDDAGRFFLDSSNAGFTIGTCNKPESQLRDVLRAFARPSAPELEPLNACAEDYLEQLNPVEVLAGRCPLFGLRLTQVKDGSVLGLSFSHMLADAESMGQLLYDISQAYQGLPVMPRPSRRLGMELLGMKAAGAYGARDPSDEEIIGHLPTFGTPPRALADITATKVYDLWGTLETERQEGVTHSHHVVHLPEAGLSRLKAEIVQSNIANDTSIKRLSAHDIIAALMWLAREVAEGNDLSSGLKRPFGYAVDLRRLGGAAGSPIHKDFWGNSVSATAVMQPTIPATSSPPSTEHIKNVLAAAACAIHIATQTIKADPNFIPSVLALNQAATDINFWKEIMDTPDHPFSAFRDAAALTSSWRSGTMDRTDFGQGTPWLLIGKVAPITQLSAIVTIGPGADGVMCTAGFKNDCFERLQSSNFFKTIAPEVVVV
ncbi:hypothetical protein WJX74_008467 [Apatococcus lobatus]|uniref:Uncharacterized protein n=1 Tax=Apatococcus lobatus TaxID=904363 RepID=A0AAW1RZB7_9CHLO